MLAAFSFATYETSSYPLQPGDRLVLYTDGILEAANATAKSSDPIASPPSLKELRSLSPTKPPIKSSPPQIWSKSQNDDLTVLICDYAAA